MTPANLLSLLRLLIVPFFFTALVSYEAGQESYRWSALVLFTIASLTDALDGLIARVWNQRSRLGCFLDPLADKLLLLSGYIGLLYVSDLAIQPPLWVTVTIVFRDLILVCGLVILFVMTKEVEINPSWLGKATTMFQMITLIVILLQWEVARPLWLITVVLTIISFFDYAAKALKKMNRISL